MFGGPAQQARGTFSVLKNQYEGVPFLSRVVGAIHKKSHGVAATFLSSLNWFKKRVTRGPVPLS